MNNINLASQEYWDCGYSGVVFNEMPNKYPIVKKVYSFFKKTGSKNVFEIGCFPGRFLYHFGKIGYELNGIDQTKYLNEMVEWFKGNNFKVGKFVCGDIFNISYENKYDVVFSSGFLEHFINYEEVLKIHAGLVKDGGHIFITVPNFSGRIQKQLHSIFDLENLNRHYLPSMDILKWKEVLKNEGFEIKDSGYIGGFDFWVDNQERSIFKKIFIKIMLRFVPIRFLPNNKSYSPEMFLIAKKII
jgi:SAM-dependent methyltransferase